MNNDRELQAIDAANYALTRPSSELFPASDPPYFVGSGAVNPPEKPIAAKRRNRSAEMASDVIDQSADLTVSSEQQKSRKRRLLKGPKEFRDFRRDHLAHKG